ncbi:hypothetical protein [Paraglaciecola sp. MB-3u-78]|uniref:hypothetical protein n=1 Tax=Paraglaciecola sp. MB-3u-78 TaxID=2058332 RepID=UPI000C32D2B7|nr:hypothetical protein [Paraglaciecola sp. MB-3u-78]PKG97580.1 hypothetical protein CXF95_19800 [Paraglaciecola sp. MB-3u-78]
MESKDIFEKLTSSEPKLLTGLPDSFGIYALWDHEKQIRYIGCTPKATEGFRIRAGNKHVTGSEGRSHKLSQAYCTGRMWRYCKKLDPESASNDQSSEDATLAKRLRTLFIRKYCGITFVEIPENGVPNYFNYLTSLESQVQNMAPASMRAWEGLGFKPCSEPSILVDQLIDENPDLQSAAERQQEIYNEHVRNA